MDTKETMAGLDWKIDSEHGDWLREINGQRHALGRVTFVPTPPMLWLDGPFKDWFIEHIGATSYVLYKEAKGGLFGVVTCLTTDDPIEAAKLANKLMAFGRLDFTEEQYVNPAVLPLVDWLQLRWKLGG